MPVLIKHKMKDCLDGRVVSMIMLGIKASSVAAVHIRSNCGTTRNLFHFITNEETHLCVTRRGEIECKFYHVQNAKFKQEERHEYITIICTRTKN